MRRLLPDILSRMSSSGDVIVFQWNRESILLSASRVWLWVQRDGGKWSFPDMDQKTFIASPASGNESWGCRRDPSDSPRKSTWRSPRIDRCRVKGGCSQILISSKKFDSSILRLENKFSFFFGKYHLFRIESFWVDFRCVRRFQLLNVCNQYVTLPNSHRVQCVSEEQSSVRLSFIIGGFLTGPSQLQGDTQPVNQME